MCFSFYICYIIYILYVYPLFILIYMYLFIIYVYKSTCDWHARALKRFRVTLRLFLCFGNNSWTQQESVTGISMLIISNRVKLCSLAFTAARMYATGAQAYNNPVVFFDIAADSEPLVESPSKWVWEKLRTLLWEGSAYEY